jgi:serine/threonine protein kinase
VSDNFPVGNAIQPVAFAAGSRVAGYMLEEQIGSGGMAVVFRARDERLQRRVAMKILAPALAADEEFRHRFIRESRAAAAVDDPHIIPVFEAGDGEGVLFIAMRYVPGGDVRTLLRRTGPLPGWRAMAIISPVASALDAAHGTGLVHRDVKPANMLVDTRPGRPDHVYLSDFGLSKAAISAGPTISGQFLGTPGYSAPEQIEGRPVDGRADQYSLACAAFELLCGEAPFPRDHVTAVIWAHMSERAPMLTSRRPDLPPGVDGVLARALAKAPGDRYASCREFADALRETLDLAAYNSSSGSSPRAAQPARPEMARQGRADQNSLPSQQIRESAFADTTTQAIGRPAWSTDPGQIPAGPNSLQVADTGHEAIGRRRRSGLQPVALSVGVALAILGVVIGLVVTRVPTKPSHATVPPLPTVSYVFPQQQYGNGLLIARKWTLGGERGSRLTEAIAVSNPTGNPVAAWFKDSIPAAIAHNVQTVRFSPGTVKVIKADPAVEWYLRIPAYSYVIVGYVANVPPAGVTIARLAVWAKGLNALEKQLNTPAPKRSQPTPTPTPTPTQTSMGSSGSSAGNGNGNNPNPYPTYSCDPTVVTCTPTSSSPSAGGGGGNGPGF